MKKNHDFSWLFSTPVIILAFIFFWPIGVFLVVKRISDKPAKTIPTGKTQGVFGSIFITIALVGIFMGIYDGFDAEDIKMILLFGVIGWYLQFVSKQLKKESHRFRQYLYVMTDSHVYNVQQLASITGQSHNTVKDDLQKMIKNGYLKNAYIDKRTDSIVLPNDFSAPPYPYAPPIQEDTSREKTGRVVVCPSCGAKNIVYDKIIECEYCDTPLQ
ncbi:MAG: hypothetical protein ACOX6G_01245 [Christensenellales bacterium]|jgi:hypothetical protein